jgi:hypothetical protein
MKFRQVHVYKLILQAYVRKQITESMFLTISEVPDVCKQITESMFLTVSEVPDVRRA